MIEPVAICAPAGRDGAIVLEILRSGNVACQLADPVALIDGIASSTYAASLLTEEAVMLLSPEAMRVALAGQPPWSDLPFVVLTSKRSQSPGLAAMLKLMGNVVQVVRPVHPAALTDLVRNALRARQRQLEARRYLEEREIAETRLRNFSEDLERKVADRTHALTSTSQRLEIQSRENTKARDRLNQLQAELIHVSRVSAMGTMASTLAHELNQPLTAVTNYLRGSIRLLHTGTASIDLVVVDGLESAVASAHRAGEIVRRLRDLVSRGVVNRRPEQLSNLIDEAIAIGLVDGVALGTSYTLSLDPGVSSVVVDRVQIQQVLINLLRNAVEAMRTADTREIVIAARCLCEGVVEVSVADTGPGLSPELLETLFSSFRTTKDEGMGVGLSICRTIVEANGGTISGENRPEGGAEFRFTLPAGTHVKQNPDRAADISRSAREKPSVM